jgi:RimJ/RimL family protein N-acetyltransferase
MAAEVRFRPLAERDLPMLVDWLARPHVRQWWGGDDPAPSLEEAREQYLPRLAGDSAVRPHIAELDGEPIGFIQSYVAMQLGEGWWPDETDPGVLGIVRRALSGSCARS